MAKRDFIIGLSALAVVGGAVALRGEPFANGGFEAEKVGWAPYNAGYSVETAVRHSGERAVKLVSTNARGAGAQQEISYAKPDRTPVVFGGWCKSANAAAHPQFYLDIEYDDGSWEWAVHVSWRTGTYDWTRAIKVFEPKKPVRQIKAFLLLRDDTGTAWFDDVFLARRDPGFELMAIERTTDRPFRETDYVRVEFGRELSWTAKGAVAVSGKGKEALVPVVRTTGEVSLRLDDGKTNVVKSVHVPPSTLKSNPLHPDEVAVWTADSMRMVTPLTFPKADERRAAIELELAGRERESAQVLVSTGDGCELSEVDVTISPLVAATGKGSSARVLFKGEVSWNRVGYLARNPGYKPHPLGVDPEEKWLPDPLLPPKPFTKT